VTASGPTVSLHLQALGLSYPKPCYRDVARNEQEIESFLNHKFLMIQRIAKKMGADIEFEDEAGVGVMTRSGRTWGAVGHPPEIPLSMERGGYNLLSMITPEGTLQYTVTTSKVNSEQYSQFIGVRDFFIPHLPITIYLCALMMSLASCNLDQTFH
jgi:hypothetical protein